MYVTARIDWAAVLDDIAYMLGEVDGAGRVPVSTVVLATELAVARGTLRGWLEGSEPRHTDGERLLARWCQLTGKPRTFAPMERRSLTAAQR